MQTVGLQATSQAGVLFSLQRDDSNNLFFVISGGGLPTLPALSILPNEVMLFWQFLQSAKACALASSLMSAGFKFASTVVLSVSKDINNAMSVTLSGNGLPDGLTFPITAQDATNLVRLVQVASSLILV